MSMTELLRGAHLLLAPSSAEGFNLPPLEAMAAGVPVLCSDIAVHQELFSSAAALFPVNDPSGLARVLSRLWPDAGAREAMRAAGECLVERYTWQASARGHWEAYASVVADQS